jgi:hypothetical protein
VPLSWSTHRRRQRGAVAVEAALVTPFIVALFLAIVEFGMVFMDSLAVSSSVRAGARLASAEARTSTYASDAASQVAREGSALDLTHVKELWVYKAAADGTPVGSGGSFASCGTACVKFRWDGTAFVEQSSSWPAVDQNACQGDPNRDSVGVYLLFEHQAVTGLFFKTFDLAEHTVMSLEPIPSSKGCKKP